MLVAPFALALAGSVGLVFGMQEIVKIPHKQSGIFFSRAPLAAGLGLAHEKCVLAELSLLELITVTN